jgi:hypothetical protein
MNMNLLILFLFTLLAQAHEPAASPADCGHMEVWDFGSAMCMPLAMEGMPMSMLMVHGNAFGAYVYEGGARGTDHFAAPNMFMADLGTSLGDRHYLNLEFMGTLEKWTVPKSGYPELLQIGEHQENGAPFLDAQHPHSSPIMGLTLSDTIRLGEEKDFLKLSFAPRGESTEGPIAFMHRPTGMVNPDAPLGHHIGQDVGHITSTVFAGALRLGSGELELSAFHGEEPEPTKVDLPFGAPNSLAARFIQQFTPRFYAMISASDVRDPERDTPDIHSIHRFSASAYNQFTIAGMSLHNALIYGLVTNYDHAPSLSSIAEEFWLQGHGPNVWGRIEVLERTPNELLLKGFARPDQGRWVTAATLGYTHDIAQLFGVKLGIGASVTRDFLPDGYRSSYGGNPYTGRLFLRASGMEMWNLGGDGMEM